MSVDRLVNTATPLPSSALDALDALGAETHQTRAALVRAAVCFALASEDRAWTGDGYRRPGRPVAPRTAHAPRTTVAAVDVDDDSELEDGDDIEVEEPEPEPPPPPRTLSLRDRLVLELDRRAEPASPSDLATACGDTPARTSASLANLAVYVMVKRVGRGQWIITDGGRREAEAIRRVVAEEAGRRVARDEEPAPAAPAAPSRCSIDEILVGVGLAAPEKGAP